MDRHYDMSAVEWLIMLEAQSFAERTDVVSERLVVDDGPPSCKNR
jgi:hypothetical protein